MKRNFINTVQSEDTKWFRTFMSRVIAYRCALVAKRQVVAQVATYEHNGYKGRTVPAQNPVEGIILAGFHPRVSSVLVLGTGGWFSQSKRQ